MDKLTATFKVVTPLFLGGAEPDIPELRAPSIKGAMRFWYRALNGHLELSDLRTREADIFGSSDAGSSKFLLRVSPNPAPAASMGPHNPLPRRNPPPTFIGFNKGSEFQIIISAKNSIDTYRDILQATILLGGLGRRSRRGFGSLKITQVDNEENVFIYSLDSICALLNSISPDNFKTNGANKIVQKNSVCSSNEYPHIQEIEIGSSKSTDQDSLLKKICESSHKNNSPYTGFVSTTANDYERVYGSKRLSSPVYVSIIEKNGCYFPIVTRLKTAFKNKSVINHDKSADFIKDVTA